MNWELWFWFALMILFLVVEANTVVVVSLWFAVGALAALIAGFFLPFGWQAAIFLVVSGIFLAALRPFVRKYIQPKIVSTNVDAVVGTTGIVTADIDNVAAVGQVKLAAMVWTARSTSGTPLAVGTRVRVDRIEGVKIFVSPAEETANLSLS